MFLGITSHHDAKRVSSYDGAQAALDRAMYTRTGKRRAEKPNGFHLGMNRNHGVTWVRQDEDGNIGFTLYDTQVVTWCPDGSVLIDNFGTVTTTGFASRFLPLGIHLRYPVSRRGEEGGDKAIGYRTADGYRICHGSVVRFVETDGCWLPDEATCDPIDMPALDRAGARDIAKALHLKAFEDFLAITPRMVDIDHDGWDLTECVEALKAGKFREAIEHLPLIVPGSGFGLEERVAKVALPIRTGSRGSFVTMGSIAKLKLAVYEDEGMFETVRHTTIDGKAFAAGMRRVRELEALGAGYGRWGLV